ncbi:MAG TPA: hypothetical protein V6D07_09635 [Trichocoleus sp.]
MTTSVKEQLGTDWQKTQAVSAQRFSRIQKIVKAAASEAFSEFKIGATEVRGLSHKTLANLVAYLKAQDAIASPQATPASSVTLIEGEVAEVDEKALPTWRQLLVELFGLARERRAEWLQVLREQVKRYPRKLDQDLTVEYGDRYQRVKDQFKKAQARYQSVTSPVKAEAPAKPVEVEVLED